MALARGNQEYIEAGVQAGPIVVQEYVEFADSVATDNAISGDMIQMPVEMFATLTVDAVVTPPSGTTYIKRVILTAPNVVKGLNGRVDTAAWSAAFPAPTYEDWGRLRVVIGGRDVTYLYGIPTIVQSWSKAQPFGDATATVLMPQFSSFDDYPRDWLGDPEDGEYRNIDIYRIAPNGARTTLWEGFIASFEDSLEGLSLQCIGALYQLDLYLRRARLVEGSPRDIADILKDIVTPYGNEQRTLRFRPLTVEGSLTGIEIYESGGWGSELTSYVSEVLGMAWVEDGSTKWSIDKDVGRRPVMRLKDPNTTHYTIHVGQPGVTHDIRLDLTSMVTTVFGEGVSIDNCKWYNAKYPNQRLGAPTAFFGTNIGPAPDSSHNDSMLLFEREMYDRGWTGFTRDGIYTTTEESLVRQFQESTGITVDGIIGPQTWAAAFVDGTNAGDPMAPYIAPLASKQLVNRYLYAPDGSIAGENPYFDPGTLRVERYENFGARISKAEGQRSAALEVTRDWRPKYFGTITLAIDPPQCSRFDMVEGTNIQFRGFRDGSRHMHIAKVDVDFAGQTVALTVDEAMRDAMTLGAILRRDRDTTDPARRKVVNRYNKSRETQDQMPVWDCENGAGVVPYHAVAVGVWNVIKIPAGKLGTIVDARFETVIPSRMAVGIFDRPWTANQMKAVGAPNPQAGDPLYFEDYWKTFGDELLNAWGDKNEPGGYSPGRESDNDALTGVLEDRGSWYFESTQPPWLWVAMWVDRGNSDGANYISGRLFPNNETS